MKENLKQTLVNESFNSDSISDILDEKFGKFLIEASEIKRSKVSSKEIKKEMLENEKLLKKFLFPEDKLKIKETKVNEEQLLKELSSAKNEMVNPSYGEFKQIIINDRVIYRNIEGKEITLAEWVDIVD